MHMTGSRSYHVVTTQTDQSQIQTWVFVLDQNQDLMCQVVHKLPDHVQMISIQLLGDHGDHENTASGCPECGESF